MHNYYNNRFNYLLHTCQNTVKCNYYNYNIVQLLELYRGFQISMQHYFIIIIICPVRNAILFNEKYNARVQYQYYIGTITIVWGTSNQNIHKT